MRISLSFLAISITWAAQMPRQSVKVAAEFSLKFDRL